MKKSSKKMAEKNIRNMDNKEPKMLKKKMPMKKDCK